MQLHTGTSVTSPATARGFSLMRTQKLSSYGQRQLCSAPQNTNPSAPNAGRAKRGSGAALSVFGGCAADIAGVLMIGGAAAGDGAHLLLFNRWRQFGPDTQKKGPAKAGQELLSSMQ